jgi:hypothetical protein
VISGSRRADKGGRFEHERGLDRKYESQCLSLICPTFPVSLACYVRRTYYMETGFLCLD